MHSYNVAVKLDGYAGSGDPAYSIDGYTSSTDFYSAPIKIMRKVGYSMTFSCPSTGSPEGHVYLQACNDEERIPDVPDNRLVNWVDIPELESVLSGDSVIIFEDREPMYRWLRVFWDRTSGTIAATISLHTKQESGNNK